MAQFSLSEEDYTWVTQFITGIAGKYAQGRIVSVLEGGYELHALGRTYQGAERVLTAS